MLEHIILAWIHNLTKPATALDNISFSNSSSDGKKCQNCPAGRFKGTFDVTCRPCVPGRVAGGGGGLAACSDCIPGKVQPLHGKTSCRFCEKGRFQLQSRGVTCEAAGVGWRGGPRSSNPSVEGQKRDSPF